MALPTIHRQLHIDRVNFKDHYFLTNKKNDRTNRSGYSIDKRHTPICLGARWCITCVFQDKPFKFWCEQDFDEIDGEIDDSAQHSFIPDGNLIKREDGKETVYKNWLHGDEKGPYTTATSEETFYYLSGKLKMDGETEYAYFKMQLCSSPMNYLSEDALDGCDVWVRSGESIQPRRSERLKNKR